LFKGCLLCERQLKQKFKNFLNNKGYAHAKDINELVDVSKIIPEGVICLTTALFYYNLTTYIPLEYQIAVPNNKSFPKKYK
jgi:predicted transcriptional regulator of viral defense system